MRRMKTVKLTGNSPYSISPHSRHVTRGERPTDRRSRAYSGRPPAGKAGQTLAASDRHTTADSTHSDPTFIKLMRTSIADSGDGFGAVVRFSRLALSSSRIILCINRVHHRGDNVQV
jgi:hypothetical protein